MTIVQIEWIDASSNEGWHIADVSANAQLAIHSVGILVLETEEAVTISTSRHESTGQYADPLTIPRSAIVGYWEIELE